MREIQPLHTHYWWRFLCAIAALNVGLWVLLSLSMPLENNFIFAHVVLSGIYTGVCAYRSVLPRIDLERLVYVNSPLSGIALGRSAATIAEISFGLQLGLVLFQAGEAMELPLVTQYAWVVPVLITLAQFCCWHSILTLNHITQALESFCWSVAFIWVGVSLTMVAGRAEGVLYAACLTGIVLAALFVLYVFTVDIPMYIRRYLHHRSQRTAYLSLTHGFRDALFRRETEQSWTAWKADAAWLTPYFSVGVWSSLGIVWIAWVLR